MKISFFNALFIFGLFQFGCAERTFDHWQCSMLSNNTIQSLVDQFQFDFHFDQNSIKEAFRTTSWPDWMLTKYPYINCVQKGLKHIPQGLNAEVQILDLGKNSITHIGENDFKSYSSLLAISLSNNCMITAFYDSKIRRCSTYLSVAQNAWSNLNKLKYLDLSGTAMKQLPELLPSSIRVLIANFASLSPIHKETLTQLTSLEVVSFSKNCITADQEHFCARKFTILYPIFTSPNLTFLDLSYNNFSSVPSYLFQESLLGIDLQGNPMNWISKNDFVNATNITYLNLAWTSQYIKTSLYIENGSFALLENLQVLDLSANMIKSLPVGILSKNVNLRALNLEFNCLKMIATNPSILPALPLLEELLVAGNTFCTGTLYPVKRTIPRLDFDESYLRFPNLTTLSLGRFIYFPNTNFHPSDQYRYLSYGLKYDVVGGESFKVLRNLTKLRNLGLATCGIRVLNTSAFDGLNLTYIDLQINQLGEEPEILEKKFAMNYQNQIPTHFSTHFKEEPDLTMINHIGVFKKNAKVDYKIFRKLSKVTLSKNSISNLLSFSLVYFSFAIHLDLSYNRINYIHENAFTSLSRLQILNLQYNPIRHIHHEALIPLAQLIDLRLNITEPQYDFNIEFLYEAQQNLTFKYGDTLSHFYRLMRFYDVETTPVYFTKIFSIDLSYIRIPSYYISKNQPVFKPLCNLRKLIIDGAQITYSLQSNFFSGVTHLQYLSMRECWIEQFPYAALQRLHKLKYLDLSHNQIQVINKRLNFSLSNLETLILSYNFIHKVSPGTLRSFYDSGLRRIDLSFNQFKNINPSIIDKSLLQEMDLIDLRGNAVTCDCSLSETFGLLVQSNQLNSSKLPGFIPKCSSAVVNYNGGCIACDQSTSEKPLSLFTFTIMNNCHELFLIHLVVWFHCVFLTFLTIVLTCKSMKKTFIKLMLNDMSIQSYLNRPIEDNLPFSVFAYDGLVFYDRENQVVGDWVDHALVPRLENGNLFFKMNIAGKRDWCGLSQVQQLLLEMKASRKTIVILSEKFSSTPQCQYVFSVLEEWMYLKGENRCIAVLFGNKEAGNTFLKTVLSKNFRHNSYSTLHYSQTEESFLFWELLTNAMSLSTTKL